MVQWVKRIGIIVLTLLIFASLWVWWLFGQTRAVPEFYQQATQLKHPDPEAGSYQLEAKINKLQRDAAKLGSWEASFSEDDINAWFIKQLPIKFRHLQTAGAKDPRISIRRNHLLAAARYTDAGLETFISFELHVELTEIPNLLAVHIRKLKAGAVSLPISQFIDAVSIDGVTAEAAKEGVQIRWVHTVSGPTAFVQVPSEHTGHAYSPVLIESIQLIDGAIILSGHTGIKIEACEACYEPRSHFHQCVTYRAIDKCNSKLGSDSGTFSSHR